MPTVLLEMKIARGLGCLIPGMISLHGVAATPAPPPPVAATGSLLQMLLGLAVVLTLVLACAWFMKRLQTRNGGSAGVIRVVAGAAVGQRERVVLVEVAGIWLVVGVAPGRVNALHVMPSGELPHPLQQGPSAPVPFSEWMKRMLEQRRAP